MNKDTRMYLKFVDKIQCPISEWIHQEIQKKDSSEYDFESLVDMRFKYLGQVTNYVCYGSDGLVVKFDYIKSFWWIRKGLSKLRLKSDNNKILYSKKRHGYQF